MTKNIILIGFMGSGKTTIGRFLAGELGFDFIDTDELVEFNEKIPIPEIFQTKGESYFRKAETAALRQGMEKGQRVIATGGGIVTQDANKALLNKGKVVYLKASPDQIYKNVRKSTSRPLLKVEDVYATICAMLEERQELYQAAAHYTISVDGRTPKEICRSLLRGLR